MMNEWILSSSLLIAAMLLGRRLLRGKISLRLQYALWGVVLVRLLLPVQLFTSDFGAGTIAQEVDISEPVRQVYFSANENRYEREYAEAYRWAAESYATAGRPADPVAVEKTAQDMARAAVELDLKGLLNQLWLTGMIVMAAVIVTCNIHLSRQLKRRRWESPAPDCLLRVYVTEVLPTPCIFGMFRPVIYLTPEAAKDARVRSHVLVHEQTHYRHGDHIWSVLRSICLVLHWYNPLVWLAVKASKTDAELACDEGALARLGERERGDYGRTLIGLTCSAPLGDFLLTATTMTGSAGSIRQRIKLLMARPRNTILTLTAVILVGVLVVGCAFAGAPETTPPATEPEETLDPQPSEPAETQPIMGDPEMTAFFQDLLGPYSSWYAQALTSYYDQPAGIDLFQLFYNGIPGVDNTPGPAELAFLNDQPGYNPEFDLVRIPGQEMDRVLGEYLGIDRTEALGLGLEQFMYDPQSDCYYHSHTDTNANAPTVTAAAELPNGNWQVLYTNDFLGNGVAILHGHEDKWQLVSNRPAGAVVPGSDDLTAEVAALFGEDGDPWYLAALAAPYANGDSFDPVAFFSAGQTAVALTEQEQALIRETYGKEALQKPIFRMTNGRMDDILETYIGTDTFFMDLSAFLYCPETDAYLLVMEQPAALRRPEILSLQVLDEKTVSMIYHFPGEVQLYAATLQKRDTWMVSSNHLLLQQPLNARGLTAEEVEQVRAAFAPNFYDEALGEGFANPLACFTHTFYSDVREMSRSEFLAYFPTEEEGTEEEFRLLSEKYPEVFEHWTFDTMPIPIHRFDSETLDETMMACAGIHWDDVAQDPRLHYLEETDCYYNYSSDFGLYGFPCTGGWVYEGGAMLYASPGAIESVLLLTEQDGKYYIQAHLPALVMLSPSSHPMIPADISQEDAVGDVLDAFFLAHQENSYLYTDHDYDGLTVLSADPDRTVTFEGRTAALSEFRGNIEYLHDKEAYWKHVRQEQGISRTGFSTSCRISKLDFDGDIAYAQVSSGVTFTYTDAPNGASSGMSSDYEVLLIRVDGRWLIADVLELYDWFDAENKNDPNFDVEQMIAAHIPS